jgi:ABC-type phosphate transport system substrate-binding protein
MRIVAIIIFIFVGMNSYAQGGTFTVISNQEGAPSQMKKSELRFIFLGEKERWNNGTKIKIALMKPNSPSGKIIAANILGMNSNDFAHYWEQQFFAGKGDLPVYFKNISDLQAYVASETGAIGIIDQTPTLTNTQVVLIDGKKSF